MSSNACECPPQKSILPYVKAICTTIITGVRMRYFLLCHDHQYFINERSHIIIV